MSERTFAIIFSTINTMVDTETIAGFASPKEAFDFAEDELNERYPNKIRPVRYRVVPVVDGQVQSGHK